MSVQCDCTTQFNQSVCSRQLSCSGLQKMVRMLLDDGEKLLTKSHKVALQQLHKRWMPDVPLWDGKTIEHRATVNPDAVDVGDEAPASWEGPHLQPDASRQDQHKALQASTNCRNIALRQSSVTSTEADALAKQIAENTRKIKALKRQAAAKKQKLRDACSKQQQKASVQVEPTAKVTSQAQSKVADVQMPTNPPSSDAAPARQQGELSAKVTDHSTESPGPPNTFQLQQSGNDSPAAAKSCAVLSASSPSESKPSHLSKDQGQHRNVSCETRNRPTAESLSCNQSAKDNAISAAIRRTSHAGLAAAISQQSLDALKSNVPQILLEPRKSGLTCHTASLSQQVTADTLQYQSQSSQIISVAPSQHEPMTRSVANSDWHGHADYQASPQTQQADTAMSMDIDSANIWSPPCCDQSGPFGQLPGPALGHPSRQQAGSCDRSAWHDNVHAQHATAQAQQVWDEHADPMDIDIETNLC